MQRLLISIIVLFYSLNSLPQTNYHSKDRNNIIKSGFLFGLPNDIQYSGNISKYLNSLNLIYKYPNKQSSNLIDSVICINHQMNKSKHIFTYNDSGKISTYTSYSMYNNKWEEAFKTEFNYNSQSYLETAVDFIFWDNGWTYQDRTVYLDRNSYRIDEWRQNTWVPQSLTTDIIDESGNIIETISQVYVDNHLVNSRRVKCHYNLIGQRDSLLFETWDGSVWLNEFLSSLTYSSINSTQFDTSIVKIWINNKWENSLLVYNKFDINGNYNLRITEKWDGVNWVNSQIQNFNYDNKKRFIYANNEIWNDSDWVPGDGVIILQNDIQYLNIAFFTEDITVYYKDITSVISQQTKEKTDLFLSSYPNPFNSTAKIEYSIPASGNVKIKVYDAIGRLVSVLVNEYKLPGKYNVTFDGNNLSSGLYILIMESDNLYNFKKILLIK